MKKILFIVLLSLLLINLVGATEISFWVKRGEVENIKVICRNETFGPCPGGTIANITIVYPNNSYLITSAAMTFNVSNSYLNFSLNEDQTAVNGEHSVSIRRNNAFSTFIYLVNPRGKESTIADSLIYLGALSILIIFFILFIYGWFRFQSPAGKLLMGYAIYLSLVGISYVVWLTTENVLATTTFLPRMFYWLFIILMYGFFPIMVVSIIWYIWLLITTKQIKHMIDRGVPEDRAYAGSVKSGLTGMRNDGRLPDSWR